MKADSKKMRVLRASAIQASLARIAMIAPKSAPDRARLARLIGDTSRRADVVRKCAFARVPLIQGQRFGEPCFFFDSVMVDYENALFDLALVALPIDEARTLLTRVSGGAAAVSLNPLQLVEALVDIGRQAFRYGRVVGAIYRDTLELEVQIWLASPDFADAERARGMPEALIVTHDKVAGLRAVYIRGNDNIPTWRAEIAALRAQGLEPVPHERFIIEIFSILRYICSQIVSERDESFGHCAYAPTDLVAVDGFRRTARGGGGIVTSTRLSGGSEAQPTSKPAPDEWAAYRATLCVEDETTLGPKTQQALKLFKAGLNFKLATSDKLTANERTQLDKARIKFPTCRKNEANPPRNPFEVGLYAFNPENDVNTAVREALKKAKVHKPGIYSPAEGETLDLNRAVKELRETLNIPTSPGAASAELDDRVWAQIIK
jgi:hypothetical protein